LFKALEQPKTKESIVEMLKENFQDEFATDLVAHNIVALLQHKLKHSSGVLAVDSEDVCDDAV
jgi:hypothetical protein